MSTHGAAQVEAPAYGDHVVHMVGPVTDAVFDFLGPVSAALAERGVLQTVILTDEPAYRHLLPHFHPSIRLVLNAADSGPLRRLPRALEALLRAVSAQPTVAVHLHGLIPSLVGAYAARFNRLPPRLYFSPHGSRSLARWKQLGALAWWLVRPQAAGSFQRTIANSAFEADTLRRITNDTVRLVESPVDDAFFEAGRNEARRPLLVTGSRVPNPSAAATFAQLAVLFSDEALDVGCNWLGTADAESIRRLTAAGVGVYEMTDATDRAGRLSAAWVYVALDGGRGFPVFLAEAMAAGLPCVVWNTPYHRDVIEHRRTGLCCSSHAQLLACVAELIDSPDERQRLGAAARAEARKRFDRQQFSDSMLDAYGASAPNDPTAATANSGRLPGHS